MLIYGMNMQKKVWTCLLRMAVTITGNFLVFHLKEPFIPTGHYLSMADVSWPAFLGTSHQGVTLDKF